MLRPLHTQTDSDTPENDPVNPETELIRKAVNGDSEAMSELVRLHQVDLRYFLTRRTGDVNTADDIAQEVFVAAFARLSSLKDNKSFRSWLLTIARNKAVDHLRKLTRERRSHGELVEFSVTRECTSRMHKSDITESAEIRRSLDTCLKKLSPKARQLVQWFYFDNQSAKSIATQLKQKSSAVRMSMLRIRKTLAKCIRGNTEMEL